ncbi:hypothetical protein ACQEUU_03340 [Nonomuraea sp. CA-218870]|uniref:hypothetical protein n=1 Tax=Nonomuraea sp. CA-218870 TaxID=3239998 RepID=UPI003D939CDF
MADTSTEPKKVTLDLPLVSIQLHRPEMRMPHVPLPHISKQEMGHAVDIAKSFLPQPERVAYYGALGALTVFGVVEWPVAAAISVGTVIAQRARGNGHNGDAPGKHAAKEPVRKQETATKAATKAAAAAAAKRKATTVRNTMQRQKDAVERARRASRTN